MVSISKSSMDESVFFVKKIREIKIYDFSWSNLNWYLQLQRFKFIISIHSLAFSILRENSQIP